MSGICAVVGIGPGMGMAVARRFAREGFRIAMFARRPSALKEYARELGGAGTTCYAFSMDAADPLSIASNFTELRRTVGIPEILVYNAAALRAGSPQGLKFDALVQDFRVNAAGALACAQEVLPHMKANRRGTLLFTGGGLALDPHPSYTSLAIGKSAVRTVALCLAKEVEPLGVRVATVTICGLVKAGTQYDPDQIAERYWELHCQKPGEGPVEVVIR